MLCLAVVVSAVRVLSSSAQAPPALNRVQQEEFLRSAKVVARHELAKGITMAERVTLEKDGLRHDAQFQTVEVYKEFFNTPRRREHLFKDSYRFNVAAYELGRLLGLEDWIPVSIERRLSGRTGALTWWIDEVQMDERARYEKHIQPPDMRLWNWQMCTIRTFDQLIANIDRNLENVVIDQHWRAWMIDHTRAFRMDRRIREPRNLTQCDRTLLARMRALDGAVLKERLGRYLTSFEIQGLLARRDQIVALFEGLANQKGEAAVFLDRPQPR